MTCVLKRYKRFFLFILLALHSFPHWSNTRALFQDQEEPEGDVEGENGNSGDDEVTPTAQRSSPPQNTHDQSPPITEQIPPLDNSDTTVDNDTEPGETTKLLNEESN